METVKKQRLILYGSVAIVTALGLTAKLVKVKTKEMVTKVDYVKPKKIVEKVENKLRYSFEIPEDYILKTDENGEFIGYKETEEEVENTVTLNEYIMKKVFVH